MAAPWSLPSALELPILSSFVSSLKSFDASLRFYMYLCRKKYTRNYNLRFFPTCEIIF